MSESQFRAGFERIWWGEAPAWPTRASEELMAIKSPDLVRPMDAPSRGSQRCSNVGLEATITA